MDSLIVVNNTAIICTLGHASQSLLFLKDSKPAIFQHLELTVSGAACGRHLDPISVELEGGDLLVVLHCPLDWNADVVLSCPAQPAAPSLPHSVVLLSCLLFRPNMTPNACKPHNPRTSNLKPHNLWMPLYAMFLLDMLRHVCQWY